MTDSSICVSFHVGINERRWKIPHSCTPVFTYWTVKAIELHGSYFSFCARRNGLNMSGFEGFIGVLNYCGTGRGGTNYQNYNYDDCMYLGETFDSVCNEI